MERLLFAITGLFAQGVFNLCYAFSRAMGDGYWDRTWTEDARLFSVGRLTGVEHCAYDGRREVAFGTGRLKDARQLAESVTDYGQQCWVARASDADLFEGHHKTMVLMAKFSHNPPVMADLKKLNIAIQGQMLSRGLRQESEIATKLRRVA